VRHGLGSTFAKDAFGSGLETVVGLRLMEWEGQALVALGWRAAPPTLTTSMEHIIGTAHKPSFGE
jgi:hypothetical protein